MDPLRAVERELAANAASLRTLARDLVGATDADDLVQETALRALRSPPARPSGLGAWFAVILRRLAHNRRRDRRRRDERLRGAVARATVPPVDETLAHAESLERVTKALLGLADPYRATLLLRYFEALPPAAIAARTGVPLATVKSRLQRGLSLLRQGLDHNGTGWRAQLIVATGIGLPTVAGTLTTGALLMTKTAKVAMGAVACACAFMWWQADAGAPPPRPGDAAPTALAPSSASTESPSADATVAERQRIAPAAAADVMLAHPFQYQLTCRVHDRDGLAVAGARILLAPAGCALDAWPEATDGAGTVTLHWRARTDTLRIAVALGGGQVVPTLQEIDVHAGSTALLSLLGQGSAGRQVRKYGALAEFVTARTAKSRAASAGKPACTRPGAGASDDCRSCHAFAGARSAFDAQLELQHGLHPEALFADLLLPAVATQGDLIETVGAELLARQVTYKVRAAVLAEQSLARLPATPARVAGAVVAGTVYGEDGKPAQDVTVIWSQAQDQAAGDFVRTGKDGTFRLEGVAAGAVEVRAGGGDLGIGRVPLTVADGSSLRADVALRRGAVIHGRVRGGDEGAVWRVEYVGNAEPWSDVATVQKDGSFVLPNLPGPGRLLLWPRDDGALPAAFEPSVLPDGAEVLFDLRQRGPCNGSIRVQPVVPDGVGPAGVVGVRAEVRAWQQDSGRGATLTRGKDGTFAIGALRAGFYRVEVGADVVGWIDLGTQWVDGLGVCDLGRVQLPSPGKVLLPRLPGTTACELWQRRREGDVRAGAALGDRTAAQLPAGRWLALWREESGPLHAYEFTLTAGATTDLADVLTGRVLTNR